MHGEGQIKQQTMRATQQFRVLKGHLNIGYGHA